MNNKNRTLKIWVCSLLIIFSAAGIYYFHMEFGLWWNRPDLGNNIEKIAIRAGPFFSLAGDETTVTTVTLLPDSPEFKKIIPIIDNGWKFEQHIFLKSPSHIVEITYTDGSQTDVDVFGRLVAIESKGLFRCRNNVSEIIEEETKIPY